MRNLVLLFLSTLLALPAFADGAAALNYMAGIEREAAFEQMAIELGVPYTPPQVAAPVRVSPPVEAKSQPADDLDLPNKFSDIHDPEMLKRINNPGAYRDTNVGPHADLSGSFFKELEKEHPGITKRLTGMSK